MMPFRRTDAGIEFQFSDALAEWLSDLPSLLDSVQSDGSDPAGVRLSAPVYPEDSADNEEWWRLMKGELEQSRAADRSSFAELVESAREGTVASESEAEAFLRVLVEGRLVVAARLGLEVEEDYERLDDSHATMLQALAELQVLLLRELG